MDYVEECRIAVRRRLPTSVLKRKLSQRRHIARALRFVNDILSLLIQPPPSSSSTSLSSFFPPSVSPSSIPGGRDKNEKERKGERAREKERARERESERYLSHRDTWPKDG